MNFVIAGKQSPDNRGAFSHKQTLLRSPVVSSQIAVDVEPRVVNRIKPVDHAA